MKISKILRKIPSVDEISIAYYRFQCRRKFKASTRLEVWEQLLSFLNARLGVQESLLNIGANDIDLNSGLSEEETLVRMEQSNSHMAKTLAKWFRLMRDDNETFANAATDDILEFEYILLQASEESKLEECLKSIILLNKANVALKKAIKSNLAYPVLILATAIGLIVAFGRIVAPLYREQVPEDLWSPPAKVMNVLSNTIYYNAWVTGPIAVIFLLWLFWSFGNWVGATREKFESIPPWSINRLYTGSTFLMILYGMLTVGKSSEDALDIMIRNGSPYLKERVLAIKREYQDNPRIGQAMVRSGFIFPDRKMSKMFRSFEDAGVLDDYLREKSSSWINDSVEKITKQMIYLQSGIYVLSTLTFLFFLISLFQIGSDINNFQAVYHGHYH